MIGYVSMILAEILGGRHPAGIRFGQNGGPEQDPSSFLGNPMAQIEQAHVVFQVPSENGSQPTIGKRYIKHPELTNPPMV